MSDNQHEYNTYTPRVVGDIIKTRPNCMYRVLAVGPVRPKPFGQTILVERMGLRKRHVVRRQKPAQRWRRCVTKGALWSDPTNGSPSPENQRQKNKSLLNPFAAREKAMRKARNILALILRFFSTEPVFSAHSRSVI